MGLSCCHLALWFPAYAGMTVGFAKVSIKGEGVLLVGAVLLLPRPVVSRLRGNDGNGCGNDGVAGLRGGDV